MNKLEREFESTSGELIHHIQGILNKINADLSLETTVARMQWNAVFKVLKEKNCQPRILHLENPSFKNEGDE